MLTFPHEVFRSIPTFGIAPRNVSGSPSLSGGTQVVVSGAAIWQATIPDLSIVGRQTNILWAALEGILQGRSTPLLVQMCEGLRQPFSVAQPKPYEPVKHSDGSPFSDASAYRQAAIVAVLGDALARGVTTATIDMVLGSDPEPGQHFSIGVRLYRIRSATALGSGRSAVTFWPPAREAAASGAVVEFERPVCKMRLKDDNAMMLSRDIGRFANPSLEFIEDVT